MDSLGEDTAKLLQLLPQLRDNTFSAIYYGCEKRRFHRICIMHTAGGLQFAIHNIDFIGNTYNGHYVGEAHKTEDAKVLEESLPFWHYAHRPISVHPESHPRIRQILMGRLEQLGPLTYFGE